MRPTKKFLSQLDNRNSSNLLNLKCKIFQTQVSFFSNPVGLYPNYLRASGETVIAHVLHAPMPNSRHLSWNLIKTGPGPDMYVNRIFKLQRNIILFLWADQGGKLLPQRRLGKYCCF